MRDMGFNMNMRHLILALLIFYEIQKTCYYGHRMKFKLTNLLKLYDVHVPLYAHAWLCPEVS